MGTTKGQILEWLVVGESIEATHLLVVCDTFGHEDYPVYVAKDAKVREIFAKYDNKNMQKVMEVYALHLNFEEQLNEFRAFHFEEPPSAAAPPTNSSGPGIHKARPRRPARPRRHMMH